MNDEKKFNYLKEELKAFIEKTIKSNINSDQKNQNLDESFDFSNQIKNLIENNEALSEIKYNQDMFLAYKQKYEEASEYIKLLNKGGENIGQEIQKNFNSSFISENKIEIDNSFDISTSEYNPRKNKKRQPFRRESERSLHYVSNINQENLAKFTEEYLRLADLVNDLEDQNMILKLKNSEIEDLNKKYTIDSILLEDLVEKNTNLFEENEQLKERTKHISKENIELISINNQYIEAIKQTNEEFGESKIKNAKEISKLKTLENELEEEKENNSKLKREIEDIKMIFQKEQEERVNVETQYQEYILKKEDEIKGLMSENYCDKSNYLADMTREENNDFEFQKGPSLFKKKRGRTYSENNSGDLKFKLQGIQIDKNQSHDELIKIQENESEFVGENEKTTENIRKLFKKESENELSECDNVFNRNKRFKTLIVNVKPKGSLMKLLNNDNSFSNSIFYERRKTCVVDQDNNSENSILGMKYEENLSISPKSNRNSYTNETFDNKNKHILNLSDNNQSFSQNMIEELDKNPTNLFDLLNNQKENENFQISNLDIDIDKTQKDGNEEKNNSINCSLNSFRQTDKDNSFMNILDIEKESNKLKDSENKNLVERKELNISKLQENLSNNSRDAECFNEFDKETPKKIEKINEEINPKNFTFKKFDQNRVNHKRNSSSFSNVSEIREYLFKRNPSSISVDKVNTKPFTEDEEEKIINSTNTENFSLSNTKFVKANLKNKNINKANEKDYGCNQNYEIEYNKMDLSFNCNFEGNSIKDNMKEKKLSRMGIKYSNDNLLAAKEKEVKNIEEENILLCLNQRESLTSKDNNLINENNRERNKRKALSINENTFTKNIFSKLSEMNINQRMKSTNIFNFEENFNNKKLEENFNNKKFEENSKVDQLRDKKRTFTSHFDFDFLKKNIKNSKDKSSRPLSHFNFDGMNLNRKEKNNYGTVTGGTYLPLNLNKTRERLIDEMISKRNFSKINNFKNLSIVNNANNFSIFKEDINYFIKKNRKLKLKTVKSEKKIEKEFKDPGLFQDVSFYYSEDKSQRNTLGGGKSEDDKLSNLTNSKRRDILFSFCEKNKINLNIVNDDGKAELEKFEEKTPAKNVSTQFSINNKNLTMDQQKKPCIQKCLIF